MRFSLGLPFPSGSSSVQEYDDLVALAVATQEVGLHAVSTTDHPFPVVEADRAGHHALDPFVLLSYLASATETLTVHFSLVVAPYRNPYLLARMISSLDVLSHGRTITALGAGYLRPEFDALGAEFQQRGALLEQQVRAMKKAWTGEPVHDKGPSWRTSGNVMLPRPCSDPHPRLWRGGNTPKAMRSAVADFSGWTPFEISAEGSGETATSTMTVEMLPRRLEQLRAHLAEVGRTTAFETCFVRTGTRWLSDPAQAAEQLAMLDAAGLDWLELKVRGRTLAERRDSLAAFKSVVDASGVRLG
ncbi:TIGR03619 family F420-dependent LLM class oxidoreductase [Streptomyces sp. NPDC057199]|uniref:TIGR03619 family F420-dependent LLM class oxidoreductase n=1 Tax=Streptomyces sp. NPDC057199 TaxID=3346047 RepID=UPI00362FE5FE